MKNNNMTVIEELKIFGIFVEDECIECDTKKFLIISTVII